MDEGLLQRSFPLLEEESLCDNSSGSLEDSNQLQGSVNHARLTPVPAHLDIGCSSSSSSQMSAPSPPALLASPPSSPQLLVSPPTSPQVLVSAPTSPLEMSPASSPVQQQISPSSSPLKSPPQKRHRYSLYNFDENARVPISTIHRWQRAEGPPSKNQAMERVSACDDELEDAESMLVFATSNVTNSDSSSDCSSDDEDPDNLDITAPHCGETDSDSDHSYLSTSSEGSITSDLVSEHSEDFDESDEEPHVFGGSPKTVPVAVLSLLKLWLKHRWSKCSLKDNLKFVNSILPVDNEMPKSLYMLFKYVNDNVLQCNEERKYYCAQCLKMKESAENVCAGCNSDKTEYFFVLPVEDQVRYLFEHRNLGDIINDYAKNANAFPGSICDIRDGSVYKEVKTKLNGQYDLVLFWGSDGVQLSKSSKVQLWPIMWSICELPPHLRSHFVTISALWISESKPKMELYLSNFVESLKTIYRNGGVMWTHPKTGEVHKSLVVAPLVVADAPARAMIKNVLQHNGKYGCGTCEQKAKKIPGEVQPQQQLEDQAPIPKKKRLRRFVFQEDPAVLRTSERMKDQSEMFLRGLKRLARGVKGPAKVEELPLFDRAKCDIAEYLHSVLLGVVRTLTSKWFDDKGHPWYIGDRIADVDDFMSNIKPPDFITRTPRSLTVISMWKGSEFRNWLLFYSLPALRDYLPTAYFQHWLLLVSAVYHLLQDVITPQDLQASEIMLRIFVRDIERLYDLKDYLYNFHQLLHLPLFVERWGPLFSSSAFMFEDQNGVLTRMIHGRRNLGKELVNNLRIAQGIQLLQAKVDTIEQLRYHKKDETALGKAGILSDPDEKQALESIHPSACYEEFHRATYKGLVFSSMSYDKNVKRCNSFISFFNESAVKCFGQIRKFVVEKNTTSSIYCIVNLFKISQVNLLFHEESMRVIDFIKPIVPQNEFSVLKLKNIETKVIRVGMYVCIRPNKTEVNL